MAVAVLGSRKGWSVDGEAGLQLAPEGQRSFFRAVVAYRPVGTRAWSSENQPGSATNLKGATASDESGR